MSTGCHKKYTRDNIVFQASAYVGLLDRIDSLLDGIPVWQCTESGKYQLDIIVYGLHFTSQRAEWAPPRGIISDATGTPTLTWLSSESKDTNMLEDRRENAEWQSFPMTADWWDAQERVIGCCERVGDLFQRQDHELSDEDIVFLRQIKADYCLMLPSELFEHCRRLYPDFFDWLDKW